MISWDILKFETIFPECVARVPVSLWGSGGEAVFAKSCVCVRNRSQPSATVRNSPQPPATVCMRAIRLSTVASAAGRGLESESSGLVITCDGRHGFALNPIAKTLVKQHVFMTTRFKTNGLKKRLFTFLIVDSVLDRFADSSVGVERREVDLRHSHWSKPGAESFWQFFSRGRFGQHRFCQDSSAETFSYKTLVINHSMLNILSKF